MSELDQQTSRWLRSLKLSKQLKSIKDFHNGYYFGEILSKMGLAAKQTFHNKNDLNCIFQNYKEVRDILSEKLGVNLPTDNLIGKAKEILTVLQQFSSPLASGKIGTSSTIKNNNQSTGGMNRSLGSYGTQTLPKKIIVIEEKLQKFKDEHTRQQEFMKEEHNKDAVYRELVIQQRVKEDRQKMKLASTMGKDQDKRVMQFWTKTEQIKMDRIDRDKNLNDFLRCKKQNEIKKQREEESKGFKQGLEAFEQNCVKLGIDIEHDPDRPSKFNPKEFNKATFLERIADKSLKQENARKDKVKRLNNLNIMQKTTAAKTEKVYQENNLVQKYVKMSSTQNPQSKMMDIQQKKDEYINSQKIQEIEVAKKKQIVIVFDEELEKRRQDEYRQKRIEYMEINLARKTLKRERHNEQMQDIVNKLINLTCQCFDYQKNTNQEQINIKLWNQLCGKFIDNIPGRLDRTTLKDGSKSLTKSKFNKVIVAEQLEEYISMKDGWISFQSQNNSLLNTSMSSEVAQLIDLVHPPHSASPKEKLSSYMPLKLCLFGSTLSGRHTQALKLAQKYGINIIDLNDTIKEALNLANPPVQQKKGAKKDPKKGEEEKPQKIRLRQFGVKLKQKIKSPEEADTETLLEVFIFKVKQLFPEKTEEEIVQQFKDSEQKAIEKHTQAVKQYQDALKKQKKDPKKPVTNEPDNTPKINLNPFTKGFVVVGFPDSIQRFVDFEKNITGFITQQQKVNEKATSNRLTASQIVFMQDRKPTTALQESYLDHIFEINVSKDKLDERNQGRKLDPNTGISYHTKLNPCVPEIKGLVEQPPIEIILKDQEALKIKKYYEKRGHEEPKIHTFQTVNGNELAPEVFKSLETIIQNLLTYKTSVFKRKAYGQVPIIVEEKNVQNIERQNKEGQNNQKIQEQKIQGQNLDQIQNISSIPDVVIQEHKMQLSQTLSNFLLKKFNSICENYSTDLSAQLLKLNELRTALLDSFYSTQQNILSIILTPDDKNIKILSFQDSYNKLLSQKQGLVQIEQAKQHLLEKLDKLYDGLWESIRAKKDEAVEKRKSFLRSSWLNDHSQQLLETCQTILQIELNKATELIQFSISIRLAEKGESMLEGNEHLNFECFADGKIPPIFHKEDLNTFPQLEKMIDRFKQLISTVPEWIYDLLIRSSISIEKLELENHIQQITGECLTKLQMIANHLYNHISSKLRQYRTYFQLLLNRMDDWIIYGIKKENDTAYGYIKQIKKAINQAKKSNLAQNPGKQINQIYKPYDCLPDYSVPIPESDGIISPDECRIVVAQLKSIADDEGKIRLPIFKEYVERRIKANLFPQNLMSISMDSIHQYLVQQDYINFEEIALSIVMLGYNIPSEEQIEQLYADSKANQQDQYITFEHFFKLKTFLDSYDYKRIIFIKYMLSEVFGAIGRSVNVRCLYQTLATLNRIGAESFTQVVLESR